MWENIKEISLELLSSTSIHGLPNIIRTKNWFIRIIWIICFMIALILCIFLITQSITNYLLFEVTTKIRIFYEYPSDFPSVTICDTNPFKTNISFNFIREVLRNYSIDEGVLTNRTDDIYLTKLYNDIDNISYILKSYASSGKISDEEKKKFGKKLEEILIICRFADDDCSTDDFIWIYNFYYGNCYQFNSGFNSSGHQVKNKFSTRSGRLNGLRLELFIDSNPDFEMFNLNHGAVVIIGNNTQKYITESDGIFLKTGSEIDLVVERSFTNQLKYPFSDCQLEEILPNSSSSYLYQEIIKLNLTYTQKLCYQMCLQDILIKQCNCSDNSLPQLNGSKICLTKEDVECLSLLYSNFSEGYSEINECDCPLECNSYNFRYYTSFTEFPDSLYGEKIYNYSQIGFANKFEYADIDKRLKRNVLKINIFYDKLSYTQTIESPSVSFVSLVSDIGGSLGLCLGMSFLSFIELLEVILEITFIMFDKASQLKTERVLKF
jgi:hypothetical protein